MKGIKEEKNNKDKEKEEQLRKMRSMDKIVTLRNITLKVKKGEFVCIVGKVGSGKSTLLSTLIGDLLPIKQKQIDSYMGDQGFNKVLSADEAEAL